MLGFAFSCGLEEKDTSKKDVFVPGLLVTRKIVKSELVFSLYFFGLYFRQKLGLFLVSDKDLCSAVFYLVFFSSSLFFFLSIFTFGVVSRRIC